jgi:hypothetical protein
MGENSYKLSEIGCWLLETADFGSKTAVGCRKWATLMALISVYRLCCSFRVQSLSVSTLITCFLSMISVVGSQYKFGRCQKRQAVSGELEKSLLTV